MTNLQHGQEEKRRLEVERGSLDAEELIGSGRGSSEVARLFDEMATMFVRKKRKELAERLYQEASS